MVDAVGRAERGVHSWVLFSLWSRRQARPCHGSAGARMTYVAVYARSVWLQYIALFQWATVRGYVGYKVLLPVAQILFFVEFGVFATGGNAIYFALGNALQLTANAGIFGVIATVANERQFGTLPLLLGSPANRLVTFLSRASVNVIDGVLTVAVGLVLTVVVFKIDLSHGNVPLLALCV